MSVQDLQDALERVAQQADGFTELLAKFDAQNSEDLGEAQAVLLGTKTSASDDVRSTLDEAGRAIDEASKAMKDAAQAARDYANRI